MKKYNVQRLAGYTIDQTILIVSVIAVLVTMIIGSVGWDLLTRAGATKLVSHLRQIEQANGQFYAAHGVWPQEGTANLNVICALVEKASLSAAATGDFRNLLPAYTSSCTNSGTGTVNHTSSTGQITMAAQYVDSMDDNYLVVQLTNIAAPEAREADKVIDGDATAEADRPESGRIRYTITGGKAVLTFIANITDVTGGTPVTIPGEGSGSTTTPTTSN